MRRAGFAMAGPHNAAVIPPGHRGPRLAGKMNRLCLRSLRLIPLSLPSRFGAGQHYAHSGWMGAEIVLPFLLNFMNFSGWGLSQMI